MKQDYSEDMDERFDENIARWKQSVLECSLNVREKTHNEIIAYTRMKVRIYKKAIQRFIREYVRRTLIKLKYEEQMIWITFPWSFIRI